MRSARGLLQGTERQMWSVWCWLTVGVRAIVVAMLLAFLTACAGSGITQTSKTTHYTVQLALDGTGFGQRSATIMVTDTSGQPVVANEVVLAPVMESMGMAAPEVIAQPAAPGYYQAKGEFFSMSGEWQLDVRLNVGGNEEVARFTVQAAQQ
jgi:YtkA-like